MKRTIYLILSLFVVHGMVAQEDLLEGLLDDEEEFHSPAFKAMKIANLQSTKVADGGDLYMHVCHRFGSVKNGFSTFFGLDDANTKIQLVYGLMDGMQIGISRESLRQTYAGSAKLRLARQGRAFPLNIVLYSTANVNAELNKERYPNMKDADRLSYASQILISRSVTPGFSLQLAPSYVRQNLVLEPFQQHEQLVLAAGGRLKFSKRSSFNFEYAYNLDRADGSVYNDPLTLGVDIETGGHVFQLLFSNAQSTNEPGFLSNAEGDWGEGEVFFGFNIVRVF